MEAHQDGTTPGAAEEQTTKQPSLVRQYGRIGISALAAALHFQAPVSKHPRTQRHDSILASRRDEAA